MRGKSLICGITRALTRAISRLPVGIAKRKYTPHSFVPCSAHPGRSAVRPNGIGKLDRVAAAEGKLSPQRHPENVSSPEKHSTLS